jgi:acyl carrier protein
VPVARVWPDADVVLEETTAAATDLIDAAQDSLSADTSQPPLMRARLTETAPDEYELTLVLHHLVADGFSLGVLGREIFTHYERWTRGEKEVPAPETTFTRYVHAERSWLAGPEGDACERYWADRLAGSPHVIDLPWDRPRPEAPDFTAGHVVRELSEEQTRAVTALARELKATPFMVALAALYRVLRDLTGDHDLVVGIDSANRSWPGSEQLIGNFVNQLPLRLAAPRADASLRDLVAHVRSECLDAYAHDRLPFHRIVTAVAPPRRLGRFPLFQVKASQQAAWHTGPTLPGVEVVAGRVSEPATDVDLMLEVSDETTRLRLELVYRTELLDESTARIWLDAIAGVLAAGTLRPRQPGAPRPEAGSPPAHAPSPGRALSAIEAVVAAIWCDLLDIPDVAAEDNFFEVGGHSLAATQAVYELAGRTGVELELETFFELGTVEAVAAELERRQTRGDGAGASPVYEGEL